MKQLLLVTAALLFIGCANTEKIEPETASISFYFAPDSAMQTTFTTGNKLTWTISQASMLPGEIGIHWDRALSDTRASFNPVGPRHDVSGKISPKIYGYYAVDLLDTVAIQQLQVGTKHYDHIHMILLPESEVTTADSVRWIENHPELKSNSLVISGTVSNGTDTKPFILKNGKKYLENDLGDIEIDLSIYDGDIYDIYIHPDFPKWFKNITWENFESTDTIMLDTINNSIAFDLFENSFKFKNSMSYTIKWQETK